LAQGQEVTLQTNIQDDSKPTSQKKHFNYSQSQDNMEFHSDQDFKEFKK